MNKRLLLFPLIFALALTACTVASGQGPAMSTADDAVEKTTSQGAPSTLPDESPIPTEQAPPATVSQATASQPPEVPAAAVLPVLEPAPSWTNDVWINSETPLPLEDLRGKVVLLEFWTFG